MLSAIDAETEKLDRLVPGVAGLSDETAFRLSHHFDQVPFFWSDLQRRWNEAAPRRSGGWGYDL